MKKLKNNATFTNVTILGENENGYFTETKTFDDGYDYSIIDFNPEFRNELTSVRFIEERVNFESSFKFGERIEYPLCCANPTYHETSTFTDFDTEHYELVTSYCGNCGNVHKVKY